MFQTCPKCQYTRKESDTGSTGTCSSCGLIFAKYVEAVNRKNEQAQAKSRAQAEASNSLIGNALKLLLILALLGTALHFFQKMRAGHRTGPASPYAFFALANTTGTLQEREFMDLFENDTALRDLATPGQYTVIEVYLDSCAYCRELEAGLRPLREQRKDVSLVRIHHPGQIHINLQGESANEVQRKVEKFKTRMKNYQICGSPHIEIYGPDREPLGRDQCVRKGGTALAWNWITSETGIQPRNTPSSMTHF